MLKIKNKNRVFKAVILLLFCSYLNCVQAKISQQEVNQIELRMAQDLLDEGLITQAQFNIKKQLPIILNANKSESLLGGTASISGQIVDENSVPLNMHKVTLYNATTLNNPTASMQTDASGSFNFTGLDAGDYVVFTGTNGDGYLHYVWQDIAFGGPRLCHQCNSSVTSDSYINVSIGATVSNIDVATQLGGVITGFITDATTLAPVNTLSAIAVNIADDSYFLKFQFSNVDTQTGEYQITGIPNGNYKLYLDAKFDIGNEYIPQLLGASECNACAKLAYDDQGTDLVIDNLNTINNVNFNLNKGASISGKIVDAISGNALAVPALFLVFDELNNLITNHYILGTNSDPKATGDYFIGGLLPGSYYLQGGDGGFDNYQREVYNNKSCYWSGCDRSTGDPLVLGTRQAAIGIDFQLERGGKISGMITDDMGFGIVDANVQVQFIDASGTVVGGARARPDGTYNSARGLPAGDYAVRTGNLFAGVLTQPYINEKYDDIECSGLACDLTTADVNVSIDNDTTGIDFSLTTGLSIAGTMTEVGTGDPIPDVHVLIYKDMGDNTVKFANWATTSDGSDSPIGSFQVDGLPTGTYYAVTNNGSNLPFAGLRSNNGEGWLDILYDGILCPATGCDILTGTPIVLTSNRASSLNLEIAMTQGASISGKVTDAILNSPISDVQINVINQNGDYFGSYTTDDTGHYKTAGVPADTYYLTTSSYEVLIDVKYGNAPCYINTCDPFDANPILLSAQQSINNIDFLLVPKADLLFLNGFD